MLYFSFPDCSREGHMWRHSNDAIIEKIDLYDPEEHLREEREDRMGLQVKCQRHEATPEY